MQAAVARPLVTVQGTQEQLAIPEVLLAPVRADIVQFVHTNMAKNKRQAYAVSWLAGHQHSAESWGTGRAVARIPRVSGGGTHRAGQAAFGNMCRKGRMFAPTKVYRRWHRRINVAQKRYATVSALAASAIPALVMARGHRVDQIEEIPLVVPTKFETIQKTKEAVAELTKIGAYEDVAKARDSKKIRVGKGKSRNRRYVHRRGPLIVYANDDGIVKAVRNLTGVETAHVERLNLLQLAPGGHLGRFIIWTRSAFEKLDQIYGTFKKLAEKKTGFKLPAPSMTNADLARILSSDEIQSVLRPRADPPATRVVKPNPLRNIKALAEINPYAAAKRKEAAEAALKGERTKKVAAKRSKDAAPKNAFYKKFLTTAPVAEKAKVKKILSEEEKAALKKASKSRSPSRSKSPAKKGKGDKDQKDASPDPAAKAGEPAKPAKPDAAAPAEKPAKKK